MSAVRGRGRSITVEGSVHSEDRSSTRSSIQRLRLPRPFAWAAVSFVLLVLAVVTTVVRAQSMLGARASQSGPGLVRQFLRAESELLLVIAAIAVIAAVWAFRRFRFARLARAPGPVEVLPFAKENNTEAPIEDVVAHFRRALRDVSLSPPMSMPGDPVSQDFLQVLRTAASASTGAVGAVIGMLSAVQVSSAYRVSGVLRQRETAPHCGLTVQIACLPWNTGSVKTIWAEDWFSVAERGAHFVGAYVLPRSRICARPPWEAWRGLPIPDDLFHQYQTAQSLLREGRYEEAIEALYAALHHDPQNPYLRIQAAQLREQLGQHLDAVTDYVDIVEIQAWQDRRLWRRLRRADGAADVVDRRRFRPGRDEPSRPLVQLGAYRNGSESLLLARYRLVSALVRGSQLARQWQESDLSDNPYRSDERKILRDRLRKWLIPRYQEFRGVCRDPTGRETLPADFGECARHHPGLLSLFFQFVAVREASDLAADYSWVKGRRRPDMSISQGALRLLAVWAPLHLILTELRQPADLEQTPARCEDKQVALVRRKLGLDAEYSNWPPGPGLIQTLLDAALRWKPRTLWGWQEHYNAASVFAVVLGDENIDAERAKHIAIQSVRRLEQAVLTTGSGLASQYHKWLAFGDQDLNGLRETEWFTEFSDRYFPRPEPYRKPRSRDLLDQVLWLHITRLVRQYAALRAQFWELQIRRADDEAVFDELRRERDIADMVGEYALDYWSWQIRLRLIKEAQRLAERHGDMSSFDPRFPSLDAVLTPAAETKSGKERKRPRPSPSETESMRTGTIVLAQQVTGAEHESAEIAVASKRNGHPTTKELKQLSGLWQGIDDLAEATLRGDTDARTEWHRILQTIVAVANRAQRPTPARKRVTSPARRNP